MAFRYGYAPFPNDRREQSKLQGYQLLLRGLLPSPGDQVPLESIVDFRRRRTDELVRFRSELRKFIVAVEASHDPAQTARDVRQEMDASIRELRSAARADGLRLAAGTFSVLGVSATLHLLGSDELALAFDGFGTAAGGALIARLLRTGSKESPFAYLHHAAIEFDDSLAN